MAPRFKAIDSNGREVLLEDVKALVQALNDGVVQPTSMLFDAKDQRWAPASQHDALQAILASLGPAPTSEASSQSEPPSTARRGSPPAPEVPTFPTDDVLSRLAAYVGPNWESHYQGAFSRLLAARRGQAGAGWTWNWPGAIFPPWYLYRRLYLAFIVIMVVYRLTIESARMSPEPEQAESGAVGILLILHVSMGFLADRLLFRKAYSRVAGPNAPRDPAALSALGKPHQWVIWVPIVSVAIGLILRIVLPLFLNEE